MKPRFVTKAFLALTVAAGIASLASSACAQVVGKVKLDGKAPTQDVIDVSGVAECAKLHKARPLRQEVIVSDGKGGLGNVIVYIKKEEGMDLPAPATKAPEPELDQKGCQYHPHVLAVLTGDAILIKNSDPFVHNVHAQSEKNPAFNFAQQNIDNGKKTEPLKEPEFFHVKCEVHPWMSAYVGVIDNPYFAVSKPDGSFEIPKGLPDGDYTVVAWHEKLDKQEGKVTVKDGKGTVDFTFKAEAADATPVKPADTAAALAKAPASPAIKSGKTPVVEIELAEGEVVLHHGILGTCGMAGCSEEPDMVKCTPTTVPAAPAVADAQNQAK